MVGESSWTAVRRPGPLRAALMLTGCRSPDSPWGCGVWGVDVQEQRQLYTWDQSWQPSPRCTVPGSGRVRGTCLSTPGFWLFNVCYFGVCCLEPCEDEASVYLGYLFSRVPAVGLEGRTWLPGLVSPPTASIPLG